MKNKYLKIVSKKDFDIDEFMQAYISKYHNDERYIEYGIYVFVDDGQEIWSNSGHRTLIEHKIKKLEKL